MAHRITANLPATLERPLRMEFRQWHYPSESDYGLGVILWDIYSRQPHTVTGPLLQLPRWQVEQRAEALACTLGFDDREARGKKPYRYTVSVPAALVPFVQLRKKELRYRSVSAYVMGLIFFALHERGPKKVPHHKCAPLLREPDWIRVEVFQRIAQDFGKPERRWPKDLGSRITELIGEQRSLDPSRR